MRTQGEARFTGRWQDRSTATSIVLDSIAKQRALTEEEAKKNLRNCGCSSSAGICGFITRGFGKLDFNGYWQYPCPHGNDGGVHEDNLGEAVLDNSRNKPEYSLVVTYVVGAVVLVCMGLGIWIGVVYGH